MRKSLYDADLSMRFARCESDGLLLVPHDSLEERALCRRRTAGELTSPLPGMFARSDWWDLLRKRPRSKAFVLVKSYAREHPKKVFCFYSAALVHGLWFSNALLGKIHLISNGGSHAKSRAQIVEHEIVADDVERVNGCLATSLERTLLDCARYAALPDALAMTDCALRCYGLTRERLLAYAGIHGKRLHGLRRAIRVFEYADARSENGGESIFRGLLIQKGYMPPTELQREFKNPVTGRKVRVDAYWLLPDGREVIGELDGYDKYTDESMLAGRTSIDALIDERQRESHLTALGMPVMRVLFRRLYEPGYLEARLEAFGIPRV